MNPDSVLRQLVNSAIRGAVCRIFCLPGSREPSSALRFSISFSGVRDEQPSHSAHRRNPRSARRPDGQRNACDA
jgi:hypothetical protein